MSDSRDRPPTPAEITAHEARPRSKGTWLWQRDDEYGPYVPMLVMLWHAQDGEAMCSLGGECSYLADTKLPATGTWWPWLDGPAPWPVVPDPERPPHDWQAERYDRRDDRSKPIGYRCRRCRLLIVASVQLGAEGQPVAVLHERNVDEPPYVPCGGEDCCGPDDPNDP